QDLVALGGQLAFTACDGANRQVWLSAGSAATTRPLPESPSDSCLGDLRGLAVAGTNLFFWSDNELWRGDLAGPALLLVRFGFFTHPPRLVPFGAEVFFVLPDDGQIWRSDGTPAGTRIASELAAIPAVAA